MKKSTRTLLLWVGVFLGPFALCAICMLGLSWLPRDVSGITDTIAYFGSLALGVCFLMMLPYQPWIRVVAAVFYLPVMSWWLFYMGLIIVFCLYGDHL